MPLPPTTVSTSADIQPFYGYVDTTEDALRLIEAARRGFLPRVTRRLNELERRSMIRSGAVFVFSVEESGIKRWTEGLAWSQSRISGNFLIYREVTDRSGLRGSSQMPDSPDGLQGNHPIDGHVTLKPNGLIKKTITVKINGSDHHLISYFTQEDVRSGRLHRPTSRPDLMAIKISSEVLQSANFRYPLKLEAHQGPHSSHLDEIDNQHKGAFRSASPSVRTSARPARLDGISSGLSQMNVSDFSRAHSDSSSVSYLSQERPGHTDALYSSRAQTELGQSISSQTVHGHYNMDAQALEQLNSSSWQSSYPQESFTVGGGADEIYHPHLQLDHLHSHARRDETWAQHAPGNSRFGRGFDQNIARIDVGAHSDLSSWPQGASVIAQQQLASAPPTTTSISDHFQEGRGRDHMRTRSYPSSSWQWGHDSASSPYQLSSASYSAYQGHGVHHSPN